MDASADSAHLGGMKAIYLHLSGALALTFTIAACAPIVDPYVTPAPAPVATPPAAPTPTPTPRPAAVTAIAEPEYENFLDAPQTQGSWFYQDLGMQSRAVFGQNADNAVLAFSCLKAERQILIIRADSSQSERSARIRTETQARQVTMAPPAPGSGVIQASFSAGDQLLDAMAITKGRFAVETAGMPSLYLPAWVEVSRVIEDCR